MKLWQTQSVFSGRGISPSNDFNLGYKLTGGGISQGVSDIGKHQGSLIIRQPIQSKAISTLSENSLLISFSNRVEEYLLFVVCKKKIENQILLQVSETSLSEKS